jgi:hypothetical protein
MVEMQVCIHDYVDVGRPYTKRDEVREQVASE